MGLDAAAYGGRSMCARLHLTVETMTACCGWGDNCSDAARRRCCLHFWLFPSCLMCLSPSFSHLFLPSTSLGCALTFSFLGRTKRCEGVFSLSGHTGGNIWRSAVRIMKSWLSPAMNWIKVCYLQHFWMLRLIVFSVRIYFFSGRREDQNPIVSNQ